MMKMSQLTSQPIQWEKSKNFLSIMSIKKSNPSENLLKLQITQQLPQNGIITFSQAWMKIKSQTLSW